MTAKPTRRTLAKASAWAVPAIVTSVAAPAYAASPGPEFQAHGYVSYNRNWSSTGYDYTDTLKIYSTTASGSSPDIGYAVLNTTPSTSISNVSITFWLASPVLRFNTNARYHDLSWSTLTRDTTKASKAYRPPGFYSPITYDAYTTILRTPVTAQQGRTPLPMFAFQSQDSVHRAGGTPLADFSPNDPTHYFFVENRALVNGAQVVKGGGPVPVRLQ